MKKNYKYKQLQEKKIIQKGDCSTMKVETKGRLKFKLNQEDNAGDLFSFVVDINDGEGEILLWMNPEEKELLKKTILL